MDIAARLGPAGWGGSVVDGTLHEGRPYVRVLTVTGLLGWIEAYTLLEEHLCDGGNNFR